MTIATIDVGLAGREATPGTAAARHPVRMDSEVLWKLATPAIVPVVTALPAFRA